MRVILQRVQSSSVTIDGETIGKIDRGLTLLIGIAASDTDAEIDWMARKILNLRLFPDERSNGSSFQHSVREIGGELLAISQFTLYGNCRKGRRPSFDRAAPPAIANPLYEQFVVQLRRSGLTVETGRFGAGMRVEIVNDGPVTLLLEREAEPG
ncbi:D-aminoacyl-tRNA deacylase [Synechococcus sp. PCC 7336]|uniref:D-aminoacyl-tRNA deacylase n=1 Tax=Synechococcus sp. PCC 7336 TaxID=195250 RepID=UPI00034691A9|nr:D-aminoacyl-tRNA deacylase [Synechococcus sp. PCC 7336]